jgi:hypothetical protein
VTVPYTIERARRLLHDRFGPTWQAPYAVGKAEMATWLAERLAVPHEKTVSMIEELEREGLLRFEGARGLTASLAQAEPSGPDSQSPLTPDYMAPEEGPRGPELGTWFVRDARSSMKTRASRRSSRKWTDA